MGIAAAAAKVRAAGDGAEDGVGVEDGAGAEDGKEGGDSDSDSDNGDMPLAQVVYFPISRPMGNTPKHVGAAITKRPRGHPHKNPVSSALTDATNQDANESTAPDAGEAPVLIYRMGNGVMMCFNREVEERQKKVQKEVLINPSEGPNPHAVLEVALLARSAAELKKRKAAEPELHEQPVRKSKDSEWPRWGSGAGAGAARSSGGWGAKCGGMRAQRPPDHWGEGGGTVFEGMCQPVGSGGGWGGKCRGTRAQRPPDHRGEGGGTVPEGACKSAGTLGKWNRRTEGGKQRMHPNATGCYGARRAQKELARGQFPEDPDALRHEILEMGSGGHANIFRI
ncbi:hypothetical protein C8R44DRAFT_742877 [Mycena epipterygia]|nr:hypothetical protein C8R44DRAFT_742877 [Mycena epipterygia]